MRLAKYIAQTGQASRRKAEDLIRQGFVKVNGTTVKTPAFFVDPEVDRVEVSGTPVQEEDKLYVLLYKPAGYLATVADPFGRPTVMDLLKITDKRLYPVGRLDFDTEGLLLLTNDGAFTNQMIHPRHGVLKTYEALVQGRVLPSELEQLKNGIELEDGPTAPARARILRTGRHDSTVELKIHQGRKRQVKRMFQAIGHPVIYLKRTGFGFLTLKNLQPGKYRLLTPQEVAGLLKLAQIEHQPEDTRKMNRYRPAPKRV